MTLNYGEGLYLQIDICKSTRLASAVCFAGPSVESGSLEASTPSSVDLVGIDIVIDLYSVSRLTSAALTSTVLRIGIAILLTLTSVHVGEAVSRFDTSNSNQRLIFLMGSTVWEIGRVVGERCWDLLPLFNSSYSQSRYGVCRFRT